MKKYKPVSVPQAAFTFCRFSLAILIWLSLIFQTKLLIVLVFIILFFSAIFKVQRAPLIVLYTITINKVFKSKQEILNEQAMRFAHTLGSILAIICLVTLYFVNENVGWNLVFGFAVLKTISALGFCPASKLYDCLNKDNCCTFIKKHD